MPSTFAYRVKDSAGRVSEGVLEADNSTLVASKLRQMGFVPIAIDEQKSSLASKELHIPGFAPKAKLKDLSVFSRQFATMIDAGIPILRCLDILGSQMKDPTLKEAVLTVTQDVKSGMALNEAMLKHPHVFSKLYINMIVKDSSLAGRSPNWLKMLNNYVKLTLAVE